MDFLLLAWAVFSTSSQINIIKKKRNKPYKLINIKLITKLSKTSFEVLIHFLLNVVQILRTDDETVKRWAHLNV